MILCSTDIRGEAFEISCTDSLTGKTSVSCGKVTNEEGYPEICLNIRYPFGITADEIKEKISAVAEKYDFYISGFLEKYRPYILPTESETVKLLKNCSDEVTGSDEALYGMVGFTYAHLLPDAYVYGTDGNVPPGDFPPERGHVHGVDEAVSIPRLKRAMKIYSRAILRLNG